MRKYVVPLLLMMSLMAGCDGNAKKAHKPFAEGDALACPESTERVEMKGSSYPKYYCVGRDGRTGPWLEFDVNGRLRTRATYVRDKLNGAWTQYHSDGSVETKGQMKDDMRTGMWEQFYVNGKPRSVKNYADNHLDGRVVLFYQEGGIMAEGEYRNDFEEGPWKVYTPDGRLARECRMEHGKEEDCTIHLKDFQPSTYQYAAGDRGAL